MVPPRAAEPRLTPEAAEFVRFCYRRRTVGWPELYDEMCAVANRGLFRGWGSSELSEHGVGFGLFELPALAALTSQVVAEEQVMRTAERRARAVERSTMTLAAVDGDVVTLQATPRPADDPPRPLADGAEDGPPADVRPLALAG